MPVHRLRHSKYVHGYKYIVREQGRSSRPDNVYDPAPGMEQRYSGWRLPRTARGVAEKRLWRLFGTQDQ